MKKPLVLIAGIVAVVGLCAAVVVAEDTSKVRSSVSIKFHPGSEEPDDGWFSGRVKAKKGCQRGRTVVVIGPYGKAGSDRSNARGKFEIVEPYGRAGRERRAHRGGPYPHFAVAKERKTAKDNGDKIVCKEGRSKKVRVPCCPLPRLSGLPALLGRSAGS